MLCWRTMLEGGGMMKAMVPTSLHRQKATAARQLLYLYRPCSSGSNCRQHPDRFSALRLPAESDVSWVERTRLFVIENTCACWACASVRRRGWIATYMYVHAVRGQTDKRMDGYTTDREVIKRINRHAGLKMWVGKRKRNTALHFRDFTYNL